MEPGTYFQVHVCCSWYATGGSKVQLGVILAAYICLTRLSLALSDSESPIQFVRLKFPMYSPTHYR